MTTFEVTIIVLFAVIILLLLTIVIQFGVFLQRDGVFSILVRMESSNSKLQSLVDISNQMRNAWACDITSIIGMLRRLENCLTQDINWGELTDNQKSEILYRLTHPVVESPFKPPFNPTCETTNKED